MAHWNDFEGRIAIAYNGIGDTSHIPRVKQAGQVLELHDSQWQVMFNGLRLRANEYYGAWMTEMISRLGGFHEPQEEKVFHAIIDKLEKPESMIELGSYWGWYSLWFKWRHPSAKVILTEPVAAHLELAAANATENELEVFFVHGGIAPTATEKSEECMSSFSLPNEITAPALHVERLMAQHQTPSLPQPQTALHPFPVTQPKKRIPCKQTNSPRWAAATPRTFLRNPSHC